MNIKYITNPASLLVSVSDLKTYLRVDHNNEDALIEALIKSSVAYCENYLNSAFIQRTLQVRYQWPISGVIKLPIMPVISISSVKYYDAADEEQTLSIGNYTLDLISGNITIDIWPTDVKDASTWLVEYVAGYSTPADVPQNVIIAIYMLVADAYENRSDGVRNMTSASEKLLNPLRNIRF